MKIKKICGLYEIQEEDFKNPIVSILDPNPQYLGLGAENLRLIDKLNSNIHRMYFHDICSNYYYQYMQSLLEHGITILSPQMLDDVLEFARDKEDMIIHCHAGISRSTAIGYGILLQDGMEPIDAAKYIHNIRPQAIPNTHILGLISDKLGISYSKMYQSYLKVFHNA